jgi:HPt (histidine-containing phosphotransfer) domain-containing protein
VYTPNLKVTNYLSKAVENKAAKIMVWDKSNALLRLSNNHELLVKICVLFLETVPEKILNLHKATHAKDFELIRTISHNLNGSAGGIGAASLQMDFQFLEESAQELNIIGIEEKMKLIDEHYECLSELLKSEMSLS